MVSAGCGVICTTQLVGKPRINERRRPLWTPSRGNQFTYPSYQPVTPGYCLNSRYSSDPDPLHPRRNCNDRNLHGDGSAGNLGRGAEPVHDRVLTADAGRHPHGGGGCLPFATGRWSRNRRGAAWEIREPAAHYYATFAAGIGTCVWTHLHLVAQGPDRPGGVAGRGRQELQRLAAGGLVPLAYAQRHCALGSRPRDSQALFSRSVAGGRGVAALRLRTDASRYLFSGTGRESAHRGELWRDCARSSAG